MKITKLSDNSEIVIPRRARPKLCAVCHKPADDVVITTKEICYLPLKGKPIRSQIEKSKYYCKAH